MKYVNIFKNNKVWPPRPAMPSAVISLHILSIHASPVTASQCWAAVNLESLLGGSGHCRVAEHTLTPDMRRFSIFILDRAFVLVYLFYVRLPLPKTSRNTKNRSTEGGKNPCMMFMPCLKYPISTGCILGKQDQSHDSLHLKFILGRQDKKTTLAEIKSTILMFLLLRNPIDTLWTI